MMSRLDKNKDNYKIALPSWLQTIAVLFRPFKFLKHYRERLGEPFLLRLLPRKAFLFVIKPELVKEAFTKYQVAGNEELRPFLGDHSLFVLSGEKHSVHRKLLISFFQTKHLNAYTEITKIRTNLFLKQLKVGQSLSVNQFSETLVIDIILKTMIGFYDETLLPPFKKMMLKLFRTVNSAVVYIDFLHKDKSFLSPGRYFQRFLRRFDDKIRDQIAQRIQQPEYYQSKKDLLSQLLFSEVGKTLSEQELVDEMKTLLGAGYDPLNATLAWSLILILDHPKVYQQLMEELKNESGDRSYLEATCNEVLRYVSVVPIVDRMIPETCTFNNRPLEAGTRITACSYLTHREASIFESPEVFQPERFLNRKYSIYEFYPFGLGSRRCLGSNYAYTQLKTLLELLLTSLEMEISYKGTLEPQPRAGITLCAPDKVKLKIVSKLTT